MFFINFAGFSALFLSLTSLSPSLPSFPAASHVFFLTRGPCALPPAPPSLAPRASLIAKLMNGYMVLSNGGTHPRSSPSISSRTFSRPAGDIIVNVDADSGVRKMDTVVKLDAVSFRLDLAHLPCRLP